VVASIALAIALATPAALVLGQSAKLNRVFSPFIYLLFPVPKVVLVPIVLLFLGVGDMPKIVIITMILFFQILVLVRDAAANIRPELLVSVRSLGAVRCSAFLSRWRRRGHRARCRPWRNRFSAIPCRADVCW